MDKKRYMRVFYGICLCSMVFSAVYLALTRGAGFGTFVYQGGANVIGDFVNNLHYPTHEGGPYFDAIWASFPPLAYVFYAVLNSAVTRANYAYEIFVYAVVTALACALILFAIQRIFERRVKRGFTLGRPTAIALCVLLSGVIVYTIERGNSTLYVLAMLLFAFELRDGDKAWQREAALVLIAVAAGFKIYPCVFGLLYLLEKRYREAARLLVYGVVLFFAPFLCFSGVEGFKQFLYNQREIHSIYRNDFLTSIPSVASFLAAEFGWDAGVASTVGKAIGYAYGVALLVCVFVTQRMWLRTLLLTSLFILVPGWSAEYMAIYMALPLALFFSEEAPPHAMLYAALFGGIFVLLPFGVPFETHAPVSWNMLVSFACIYLISLLAIIDAASERLIRRARERAA